MFKFNVICHNIWFLWYHIHDGLMYLVISDEKYGVIFPILTAISGCLGWDGQSTLELDKLLARMPLSSTPPPHLDVFLVRRSPSVTFN